MSQFAGEWFAKHREEEEASLELITQLQREEATQREQERQDLEIAARLSKEINGVSYYTMLYGRDGCCVFFLLFHFRMFLMF